MTAVWGPMGWMTLHAVSACYPDSPTPEDKIILSEFVHAFAATITCIHCRQHFSSLLSNYTQNVPSWLNSRRDLFLAVCRMHNDVNKRLDKPYPKTVDECLNALKHATSYTSPSEFIAKYISYLFRDWSIHGRGSAYQFIAFRDAEKMKKIYDEYLSSKTISYSNIQIEEDDIVFYHNQPVHTRPIFPRIKLKNFRWSPNK